MNEGIAKEREHASSYGLPTARPKFKSKPFVWPIPEPDNYLACHRISQRAEPGFYVMHSQEIDHPRGLKDDCSIEDLRVRHICWVVITIAREICR